MEQLVKNEFNGVIKKIEQNCKIFQNGTPNVTPNLKYSPYMCDDGSWTGSFWMGMVEIAGLVTDDPQYIRYLDSYFDMYDKRLKTGYKDHDLGFLYQLYAVNSYRLTNHNKYREMAINAAQQLMCRYNKNGGFIRAWGKLMDPNRSGKIIIDCLLNLPLLFCSAQMSGMNYLYEGAYNHALASLNNVRADGSIYHTFNFDVATGAPIKGENEGGYADESCWSRGLAWAIYGFYLSWQHTMDRAFLDASVKNADYFIAKLGDDKMPKWDFLLDDFAPSKNAIDTSAASITVSALYDLSNVVDEPKKQVYLQVADKMLKELIVNHSRTFDNDSEVLLDSCYCGTFVDGVRQVNQWGAIFGDYFYVEALAKRCGHNVRMWNMS